MDLQKIIVDSLAKLESEGKIQAMIEKHLSEAVNKAVAEIFYYNSEIAENLKRIFKERSRVDITELSIPEYNKLMLSKIQNIIDSNIYQVGLDKFEKDIKTVLGESLPTEMKVSEIIERFKKDLEDDGEEFCGDITFFHENSTICNGFFDFQFDEKPKTSKYSCKYQVSCSRDGSIYAFRSNDLSNDKLKIGSIYGMDLLLFRLYSSGTKIIPDFDDVDLYYSSED